MTEFLFGSSGTDRRIVSVEEDDAKVEAHHPWMGLGRSEDIDLAFRGSRFDFRGSRFDFRGSRLDFRGSRPRLPRIAIRLPRIARRFLRIVRSHRWLRDHAPKISGYEARDPSPRSEAEKNRASRPLPRHPEQREGSQSSQLEPLRLAAQGDGTITLIDASAARYSSTSASGTGA